jgi:hypothetical protein
MVRLYHDLEASMRRRFLLCLLALCLWTAESGVNQALAQSDSAAPPADIVTLKDGSIIHGEVIDMTGGMLSIKSPFAGEIIKVKWAEVIKLAVSHPIPIHLKEGTVLVGTVEEADPGMMKLTAGSVGTMTVPLDSVTDVNPVVQPPAGTTDTDTLYLFTLGYGFDTTRKR